MNNNSYDRKSCCWNCRQPGHTAKECVENKQLFCSFCLTPGIATRDCKCHNRRGISKNRLPRRAISSVSHKPSSTFKACEYQNRVEFDNSSKNVPPPGSIGTMVGGNLFKTFINTETYYSVVGWKVANQASLIYQTTREYVKRKGELISEQVIPITHGTILKRIRCRIVTDPDDCITLGADAILRFGCKIELGGLTVLNLQGEANPSILRHKNKLLRDNVLKRCVNSDIFSNIENPQTRHSLKDRSKAPATETATSKNETTVYTSEAIKDTSGTGMANLKVTEVCNGKLISGSQTSSVQNEKMVNIDEAEKRLHEEVDGDNTWRDLSFLEALQLNEDEVEAILEKEEENVMDTEESI